MIIFRLTGGLGNQMFQYALAKHYQNQKNTFLDVSFYDDPQPEGTDRRFALQVFSISIPLLPRFYQHYLYSQKLTWKILRRMIPLTYQFIKESRHTFNEAYLTINHNAVLTGYFQSEKYFSRISTAIRKDFNFRGTLSSQSRFYLEAIRKKESVSMHVRRGDYLSNEATNRTHGILSLSYYLSAVARMNSQLKNPEYFVFSDDVPWVKTNFHDVLKDFIIVEGNHGSDAWQDLFLMSQCKHSITANSSFSWWGAWLNNNPDKIVISPAVWCADPQLNAQMSDLIPEGWIKIKDEENPDNKIIHHAPI